MSSSPRTEYPPLDRSAVAAQLVGGAVLLALLLWLAGRVIAGLGGSSSLGAWEDDVTAWFEAQRTPGLDSITHVASYLAETVTCVAVLIVAMVVLRLWLGRWRESVALLLALAGEVVIFLAVSAAVERDRPDVSQLDDAPPTSSFPSGHMGAAVALYGTLAVILLREVRVRWVARLLATLLLLIPVAVGLARLYRGMHYPTDVIFGAVNGGVWAWLVIATVLPRPQRQPTLPSAAGGTGQPEDVPERGKPPVRGEP